MGAGGTERLTDREKRVLRLLASGHSVKSAAAEESITENAANELLRAARRKLGTGSSREAARLFAEHEGGTQKIRDEKTGISLPSLDRETLASLDKGTIAMLAAAVAAANTPRVVRTDPPNGAEIPPGRFTVAVTFDRPMLPQAYSFVRTGEGLYPESSGPPRLSADGLTYSLDCTAHQPGTYVMHFNHPPYMNFRDALTKAPAEPARLEFTVVGEPSSTVAAAPRVVRTSPVDGEVIEPGPFRLTVTFDRAMAPGSFAFSHDAAEGAFPECTGRPELSPDGLTYTLECVASAGERYVIYFNRQPYIGFLDAETKVPAEPARLQFSVRPA